MLISSTEPAPVRPNQCGLIQGLAAADRSPIATACSWICRFRRKPEPASSHPVVRRQNEDLAIAYVGARIIESVFIAAPLVASLLVDASEFCHQQHLAKVPNGYVCYAHTGVDFPA